MKCVDLKAVTGVAYVIATLMLTNCSKNQSSTDISETGQQIGDVMASIDESGGSGGSLALLESAQRTYARLAPSEIRASWLESIFVPSAYAVACSDSSTFGSCSNNVVTRTFSDCTVGAATFSGTATLTWGGASSSCQMQAANDYVTRVPNFTVTGRRGATLSVSKSSTVGQRITWNSGSGTSKIFTFTNDGIRRTFTRDGSILLDFTTETTSGITVSGTSRANRTLNGGNLRVTNNLTAVTCDYVPSSVTWSGACNCPISGTWSGSCSDGKTTSLTITGCGAGTFAIGETSEDFTFDRCYGT